MKNEEVRKKLEKVVNDLESSFGKFDDFFKDNPCHEFRERLNKIIDDLEKQLKENFSIGNLDQTRKKIDGLFGREDEFFGEKIK